MGKCVECRYWDRRGTEFGACRRAQPHPRLQIHMRAEPTYDSRQFNVQVSGYHAPVAEWPTTSEQDWCGEFAALPPAVSEVR